MTQAAAIPHKALETLKRYAKPIPFAENSNPCAELHNIRTLMKAERFGEALDRLNRLFDAKLIPEEGAVTQALVDVDDLSDEVADLREDLESAENRSYSAGLDVMRLEGEVSTLEDAVARLTTEREEGRNRIDQLESEISALRAQIPGFGGKA